MVELREITFKNFVTLQRGFDLPQRKRVEGEYLVVASTSISGTHNEYKVLPPGVVTGRSGSLGEVQYLNQRFWPLNTTLWVKDFKGNYPKYVYFFLKTLELQKFNSGTGVPTLNRNDLNTLKIKVHNDKEQKKIAAILSAYDDLIENNNRRIEILEEMARMLYREWFVKFRYPGHESDRFYESELGLIPQGWEVVKLGSVTSVITKGTTPTTLKRKFVQEGINFIKVESIDNLGGIIKSKLAKIDAETYALLKRSQLQKNDILFSIAGAIGRTTLISQTVLPANTNQALAIIRPVKQDFALYLYQAIRSDEFLNFSLGRVVQTAQANVSLSVLSAAPILVPNFQILNSFDRLLSPIVKKMNLLREKNNNLRQTRDLLLPRLISGEIDVENLDIKVIDN